ncbi:MAG: DUF456 family protein [Gammaproteobacteria bacterium]|nr:DUF456 family protein [Gammaproteobacteria bacterium]
MILLWSLAVLLIGAGIAGLALPALPGAPLLFLGFVVAAWIDDFTYIGTTTLIVFAALALLTYLIDIIAGLMGAKRFNASRKALFGAGVGAIVGIFFGLPGILLGPFTGAVIGELSSRRPWREAGWSGIGATVGLLVGAILKLTIAFAMIGWFLFLRLQ